MPPRSGTKQQMMKQEQRGRKLTFSSIIHSYKVRRFLSKWPTKTFKKRRGMDPRKGKCEKWENGEKMRVFVYLSDVGCMIPTQINQN